MLSHCHTHFIMLEAALITQALQTAQIGLFVYAYDSIYAYDAVFCQAVIFIIN